MGAAQRLELVVVRHGVTAWNLERRYQGQRDIPLLLPDALADMDRLRDHLSDEAFDLRGLKPSVGGERPSVTRTAVFRVGHLAPVTRPGVYDVYLSVGRRDGTPQLALPLAGEDGQRRYRLGRVTLKPAD